MSKRPIAFSKPEDPSFLKRIKESIGYKEGPTVDTKRQNTEAYSDDDDEAAAEERECDFKPQVVVLRAGDLTAEEAEREKQRLLREEQERPADLTQRVVFKKPKKEKEQEEAQSKDEADKDKPAKPADRKKAGTGGGAAAAASKKKKNEKPAGKLSFADDEEEEDF